jgi:nitronate monooxygenase
MNLFELLKLSLPIIQAPMAGGATTPELVAAVSNYGALGSLGCGYMDPSHMRDAIRHTRSLLEEIGVDAIVAQGIEAGGHRGSFMTDVSHHIGLFALLPQIAKNVKVPVIAAGGIMDARGILAALTLGASGVQMGTAFLTCTESGVHPKYKEVLLSLSADNTVLTKVFSGRWARRIKNAFIERMEPYVDKMLDYPIQNAATQPMRKAAANANNPEFMALWAGQAAALCQKKLATALLQELKKGIEL